MTLLVLLIHFKYVRITNSQTQNSQTRLGKVLFYYGFLGKHFHTTFIQHSFIKTCLTGMASLSKFRSKNVIPNKANEKSPTGNIRLPA